jgi:hypothetical protein
MCGHRRLCPACLCGRVGRDKAMLSADGSLVQPDQGRDGRPLEPALIPFNLALATV